jgi:glutamine amidotransferase PdxT
MMAIDTSTQLPHLPEIGLYVGPGVCEETPEYFERLFEQHHCGVLTQLGAGQCTPEGLAPLDLLILPGGRGSQICQGLAEEGKLAIEQFVAAGKALVGICAGMYALSSQYSWSLKLVPMQVLDTKHWQRGEGQVDIYLTESGQQFLKTPDPQHQVFFANAPIVAPYPETEIPEYQILGSYESDLVHPEGIQDLMYNSPALLTYQHKKGHILCIGPHFEETLGKEYLLANAIKSLSTLVKSDLPSP